MFVVANSLPKSTNDGEPLRFLLPACPRDGCALFDFGRRDRVRCHPRIEAHEHQACTSSDSNRRTGGHDSAVGMAMRHDCSRPAGAGQRDRGCFGWSATRRLRSRPRRRPAPRRSLRRSARGIRGRAASSPKCRARCARRRGPHRPRPRLAQFSVAARPRR